MVVGRPLRSVRAPARRKPPRGVFVLTPSGTFDVTLSGVTAAFSGNVSTVSFRWDAPASGVPTGYRIYWGTSSGSYPNNTNVGNVLVYPLSSLGLSDGVTYFLVVRAFNGNGESGSSNEISVLNGVQL